MPMKYIFADAVVATATTLYSYYYVVSAICAKKARPAAARMRELAMETKLVKELRVTRSGKKSQYPVLRRFDMPPALQGPKSPIIIIMIMAAGYLVQGLFAKQDPGRPWLMAASPGARKKRKRLYVIPPRCHLA
ncbi:uncharacterized protein BO96DRAFT_397436 [Aspergillus niger CBS 101883]|uniref:Uncharacterized protein n=3 Tax=Aspergillus niger TaxID=5061 RepID=A2QSB7_ASPNC|nr:uncharacterized protein BO96DRAFT_397436 [Aspergillus niger CBS 101883]XP_059601250.1 hypothetical protein An08g10120 [Aspergillus niger]PYH54771.1 hypothetical protein BO96DRAFT_397436 [Aspergillus niger CBS 101883]RDH14059.1 hypothetical protein M747DRAFT_250360 [Aspergillus niger ATCC 13496]CAK40059.1 hypothetical protein An08g10120 [Aspergillus niger]